jgi:hypothetical protein
VPVPDNATALDQLIAFTGRSPAMTSPNTIAVADGLQVLTFSCIVASTDLGSY